MGAKEVIKELFVLLGVDVDKKEFDKATKAVDDLVKVAEKLVVGFGLASGVMTAAAVSAAGTGDRFQKTARQLGDTAESVQELTLLANDAGASFEQLRIGILKNAQRAAEAARGNKEYAKEYRRLGVDIRDTNGQLKGSRQLFFEVARAISEIENPGERARVAMRLFEEGGANLLPLFAQLADGNDELIRTGRESGFIMTNEQAAAAEEAEHALLMMKVAVIGLWRQLGVALFPALKAASKGTREFLTANKDLIRGGLDVLGRVGSRIISKLELYAEIVDYLILNKTSLKAITLALSAAFGIALAASIGGSVKALVTFVKWLGLAQKQIVLTKLAAYGEFVLIGALLIGLALLVEDFITALQGGDSLFGRFVDKFTSGIEPGDWWITRAIKQAMSYLDTLVAMAVRFVGLFSSNNAEAQAAKDWWMNFWDDIVENWKSKLNNFFSFAGTSLATNPLTAPLALGLEGFESLLANTSPGPTGPSGGTLIPPGTSPSNTFAPKVDVTVTTGSGDPSAIGGEVARQVGEKLAEAQRQAARELAP